MNAWLKRLGTPEDPRKSFDEIFGGDYARLKKELDAYLEEKSYQLTQFTLQPVPLKISVKPLSAARVHLARAELARTAANDDDWEEREEKAAREIRTAANLDLQDLAVRVEVTRLIEPRHHRIEAAKKLTQEEPNRADVWYLLASEQMKGASHEEIVQPLRKTIELNPNHGDALAALAWFMARKSENLPEARKYAERAVEREPWNPQFMDALALVLAAAGECAAATDKQTQAVELLSEYADDKLRAEYQQRLEDYRAGCKKKQ